MTAKKWVLLIISLVFLCGCGKIEEDSIKPTPHIISEVKNDIFDSKENNVVTLPGENSENQESTISTEIPEYLKIQENIDYVKYDAANRYVYWDYSMNMNSMFCLDPDTGVAYFVNQARDWYIYRLIDGKAELAVELPARELYVLNGKIYFVLEDYDKYKLEGLTEGDIYTCTIATGKVEKVFSASELEGEIYRIKPYEDGIAIQSEVKENLSETEYVHYYYNFADSTVEIDDTRRTIPGWENYYIHVAWNHEKEIVEKFLLSRTEHEKERLEIDWKGARNFIVEDTMYSIGGIWCYVTNLSTGEQKIYDTDAIFKEQIKEEEWGWGVDLDSIEDPEEREKEAELRKWIEENAVRNLNAFTVTKEDIWICALGFLLQIDKENGEAQTYLISNLDGGSNEINYLYTDGVNVYGVYSNGSVIRICTEKDAGFHERYQVPKMAVEYLIE